MRRVAVFGNAGGGKSTLAKKLGQVSGLPVYPLDLIQFKTGGGKVPHDEFVAAHADILLREEWIIDGFGSMDTVWERLSAADTLIHVDLPLRIHYLWVTKRLIEGIFRTPEGWPEGSPMWRSTMDSYRVIKLCNRHLTQQYRDFVTASQSTKQVYHLTSSRQIHAFLEETSREILM